MIYLGLRKEYKYAKSYIRTLLDLAQFQIEQAKKYPKYYEQCRAEFYRLVTTAANYQAAVKDYEARHG